LGLETGVHVPPDACSISVLRVPSADVWKPAAHALVPVKVSTLVRSESLGRAAGEASDQFDPFQRNASG
jgi:hypothetical protein